MSREVRIAAPVDPRPRLDVGPPFRRLNGGWLALDFVNTVPGWTGDSHAGLLDTPAGERLETYDDLVTWSRLEDLFDEGTARALMRASAADPSAAADVVRRAHALRHRLNRLFRSAITNRESRADDVRGVNDELRRLNAGAKLEPSDDAWVEIWSGDEGVLDAPLWSVLHSARTLLTTPELLRKVGQCSGPGCGWLFIDVGRGRSRRWCDTRDCGNVAKVRAYRRRQRQS